MDGDFTTLQDQDYKITRSRSGLQNGGAEIGLAEAAYDTGWATCDHTSKKETKRQISNPNHKKSTTKRKEEKTEHTRSTNNRLYERIRRPTINLPIQSPRKRRRIKRLLPPIKRGVRARGASPVLFDISSMREVRFAF